MDEDQDFQAMLSGAQTAIQRALFQESYLADSLLAGGMTALRRLSFNNQGRALEGFFCLANGVERIAKLILVSDEFARTGAFPDPRRVRKNFGHDLRRLLLSVEEVAVAREVSIHDAPSRDGGSLSVVDFLNRFARTERYYNLNRLAQGDGPTIDDPVSRWVELVKRETAPRGERRPRIVQERLDMARRIDTNATLAISFNSLDGRHIGTLEQAALQEDEDEWLSVEGTKLAARPVRFLARTIGTLNNKRGLLPYYSEIFRDWQMRDSAIRRQRGFPKGRS